MRLLGTSPCCGTEDSIVVNTGKEGNAACETCEKDLGRWMRLVDESSSDNRLIPVQVQRAPRNVGLLWPRENQIPHFEMIRDVLLGALRQKFNLSQILPAKRCPDRILKGDDLQVKACNNHLAISIEEEEGEQTKQVLDWFAGLLCQLFKAKLSIDKREGRGDILKLVKSDYFIPQAQLILIRAIAAHTGSNSFALKSFHTSEIEVLVGTDDLFRHGFTPREISGEGNWGPV